MNAEQYLNEALGGNMNIGTLKPLAWHKIMEGYARHKLVEAQATSTNTASFQLPITMESCIEHLRSMWGNIHITAEVRCAVEETHDFIERQLQTLL